jgi:hypothetical protein
MTDSNTREPVREEEQIDQSRSDREPGTPGSVTNDSFPYIEDAPNPEDLAGDEHDEKGQEEQVEAARIRS